MKWFFVNGKPAFKGILGGRPRLIVGETREQLEVIAALMAVASL